jgi:hypothetical protein
MNMKKIILASLLLLAGFIGRADEGMWIPMLIAQNYDAMQRLGLRLTPDQVYSINQNSLKDAVVQFGGGCTGEIISDKGLLITNHHCGYDAISKVSSVSNNILINGFMANGMKDELPCNGLSVKFLVRIEDVSDKVKNYLGKASGKELETKFDEIAKTITKEANADKNYESDVKSFYGGNQYFLFVYERYTDIRLVATPPENMGKFGKDADNWMWPRHTCDFSMFRVYANTENKPASYSPSNQPYVPKHHLPVSLKGVHENDYAMIMGYPGRTTRYLTSYGVNLATSITNPSVVKIREKRLSIMRGEMDKDMAVNLQYASTYASVANYWKYFIGQTEQLKNLHIYEKKQGEEKEFMNWANNKPELQNVLPDFQKAYEAYTPFARQATFYREAFMAPDLMKFAASFENIAKAYTAGASDDSLAVLCTKISNARKGMLGNMNVDLDRKVLAALHLMYYQDVPAEQHPAAFADIVDDNNPEDLQKMFTEFADDLYAHTALLDSDRFNELCNAEHIGKLLKDPAISYALSVVRHYRENLEPKVNEFTYAMMDLNRSYQGALLEKNAGKQMYPDANSTMRLTYGKVKAYNPKDAVSFKYYTTADGLLEKYKAGDEDFDLQPKVVELLKNKDFGQYADKELGNLVTCFITDNDITGGNSGSPVMNGNGEFIGIAFDGNWEAMSGDIAFDTRFKRTICADARYIFWVVDKVLGGAPLMKELDLKN